jgi:hypothetical protein
LVSSFLERLPNFVDLGSFALMSGGYSPTIDPRARIVPSNDRIFKPDPFYPRPYNAEEQIYVYGGKHADPTARPLIEAGRELYQYGPFQPGINVVGKKNLVFPQFSSLAISASRSPTTTMAQLIRASWPQNSISTSTFDLLPRNRIHAFFLRWTVTASYSLGILPGVLRSPGSFSIPSRGSVF